MILSVPDWTVVYTQGNTDLPNYSSKSREYFTTLVLIEEGLAILYPSSHSLNVDS